MLRHTPPGGELQDALGVVQLAGSRPIAQTLMPPNDEHV